MELEKLNFPIYLYNSRSKEYFRYSEGANVLKITVNSIFNHWEAFKNLTEEDYKAFLINLISKDHVKLLSKEQFSTQFLDAVYYLSNVGSKETPYFTKEQIRNNRLSEKYQKGQLII